MPWNEDPNALYVVRHSGGEEGTLAGLTDSDEAFAHQFALLSDEFAIAPPSGGTYASGGGPVRSSDYGRGVIPRYVAKDEDDAHKGGKCGRCFRYCPASRLAMHGGKRLCEHCRGLRQDPTRVSGGR